MGKRWTKTEIATLKSCAGIFTTEQIMAILEKSRGSVLGMAHRQGISLDRGGRKRRRHHVVRPCETRQPYLSEYNRTWRNYKEQRDERFDS